MARFTISVPKPRAALGRDEGRIQPQLPVAASFHQEKTACELSSLFKMSLAVTELLHFQCSSPLTHLRAAAGGPVGLGPCTQLGNPGGTPGSWPQPSCLDHLESEPVDGLSLFPSLCKTKWYFFKFMKK